MTPLSFGLSPVDALPTDLLDALVTNGLLALWQDEDGTHISCLACGCIDDHAPECSVAERMLKAGRR